MRRELAASSVLPTTDHAAVGHVPSAARPVARAGPTRRAGSATAVVDVAGPAVGARLGQARRRRRGAAEGLQQSSASGRGHGDGLAAEQHPVVASDTLSQPPRAEAWWARKSGVEALGPERGEGGVGRAGDGSSGMPARGRRSGTPRRGAVAAAVTITPRPTSPSAPSAAMSGCRARTSSADGTSTSQSDRPRATGRRRRRCRGPRAARSGPRPRPARRRGSRARSSRHPVERAVSGAGQGDEAQLAGLDRRGRRAGGAPPPAWRGRTARPRTRGREPAQPPRRPSCAVALVEVEDRLEERRLRLVHLGRDGLHPLLVGGAVEQADGGGVPRERTVGEGVDLGDRETHEAASGTPSGRSRGPRRRRRAGGAGRCGRPGRAARSSGPASPTCGGWRTAP